MKVGVKFESQLWIKSSVTYKWSVVTFLNSSKTMTPFYVNEQKGQSRDNQWKQGEIFSIWIVSTRFSKALRFFLNDPRNCSNWVHWLQYAITAKIKRIATKITPKFTGKHHKISSLINRFSFIDQTKKAARIVLNICA